MSHDCMALKIENGGMCCVCVCELALHVSLLGALLLHVAAVKLVETCPDEMSCFFHEGATQEDLLYPPCCLFVLGS